MNDLITATFANDFDSAQEARSAAEPFLESKSAHRVRTALGWLTFGLMACGIYGIAFVLIGSASGITGFIALLVSLLGAYGVFYATSLLDRRAYARFCKTSFGANASITIDPSGFSYKSQNSHWTTGWGDVIEVFITKNTLGVITPSMPIYVPSKAFDDPKAVFLLMTQYHKDAQA